MSERVVITGAIEQNEVHLLPGVLIKVGISADVINEINKIYNSIKRGERTVHEQGDIYRFMEVSSNLSKLRGDPLKYQEYAKIKNPILRKFFKRVGRIIHPLHRLGAISMHALQTTPHNKEKEKFWTLLQTFTNFLLITIQRLNDELGDGTSYRINEYFYTNLEKHQIDSLYNAQRQAFFKYTIKTLKLLDQIVCEHTKCCRNMYIAIKVFIRYMHLYERILRLLKEQVYDKLQAFRDNIKSHYIAQKIAGEDDEYELVKR
jgi:hypothetical protein